MAAAIPNAITATQMWARIRRFAGPAVAASVSGTAPSAMRWAVGLVLMGHPAQTGSHRGRVPLRSGYDVQLAGHRVVTDAAVFVARDQVLARGELGGELADIAGNHHYLAIGPDDLEPVGDVHGCEMEGDWRVRRHSHFDGKPGEHEA